ncbi:hypothetical protein ACSBOX_12330 [Arthrobacter sp. KN11-1C]|uniref:hypothetical protein n=1 Tax=Arthrobacter sp. KN11-1C TaxID=3445774 RepID=UPI003FA070DD
MANKLKVGEVFVPGKLPALTYNPRAELHLERDLQDYLDETGAILTVAGPTKTGKSVLVERVVSDPVWVDGQGIDSTDTLWRLIADQLGAYHQIQVGEDHGETGGGDLSSEAGLPGVAKIAAKAAYSATDSTTSRYGADRPMPAVARQALVASGRTVVIDDFHFIDRPIQRQIVRALKPLVLAGVAIIFVSISHRVQDVVTAEPDMTGRVVPLKVNFWSIEDLLFIARQGFAALKVRDANEVLANRLAEESYGSPHLMQKFCRELCKANDVRVAQDVLVDLNAPADWPAFFRAQTDPASRDWFERLISGPQERGNKRTQWKTKDNGTLDSYGLTLRGIAQTGPRLELTKEDIRAAVEAEVEGAGPAANQITRALQHLSRIAAKRMNERRPTEDELDAESDEESDMLPDVQPVLEYVEDETNSRLHISDPFFAFFLRWGSEQLLLAGPASPDVEQPAAPRPASTALHFDQQGSP